jgi:O-antigen/teichoic acid export membrane protein
VTGLIGSILIVRSLTPVAYGAFSYYVWIAGILAVIGTLAFPEAITKITAELRGERKLIEARALARWVTMGVLGANLLLSAIVCILALDGPPSRRPFLLVIGALLGPTALSAVLRSTLMGRERYRPVAVISLTSSAVQLALIVANFFAGLGAPGYVFALLSSGLIQTVGFAAALGRADLTIGMPISLSFPSRTTVRRYLAFVLPATLGMPVSVVVWERSEVFFLERFSGLVQVGYYSLAYTVFSMVLMLGWALINGFYPAMSRDYGAGDWRLIQEKLSQGILLGALYAVPLTFGGWATIDGLISLLYGDKMLPAVSIARVLLASLVPGVLSGLLGILVLATGRVWLSLTTSVALCAVNIALDLILIPRYAALGAAFASTMSQLAYAAVLFAVVVRLYHVRLPWQKLLGIVGSGAITTFLLPATLELWIPGVGGLVTAIVLGAAVYLVVVGLFGHLRILLPNVAADYGFR